MVSFDYFFMTNWERENQRGKSNHQFRTLAENEEADNLDGNEAVPNPEPELMEANAEPGNNLTMASWF